MRGIAIIFGVASFVTACGSSGAPTPGPTSGTPAPAATSAATAATSSPGPAPSGADVELRPAADVTGERHFTLGGIAAVENVSTLSVLRATRGWSGSILAPPKDMAAYTWLVRFAWDGRTPGPTQVGGGYYNAISFSMFDDQGFEYPVLQDDSLARQPALLFGDLAGGSQVQGWVTFHAPANAAWVELAYQPIADDRVYFKAIPPTP